MLGTQLVRRSRIAWVGAAVLVMLIASDVVRLSADEQVEEQSETYLLRYVFTTGDAVHYAVSNHSQIELQQAEAKLEIDHHLDTNKHYTVLSRDADGNGLLELVIDRVQFSGSEDGAEPITFDSDKDENPPNQFVGAAITIGKPHVKIKASPTGDVLKVDWLVANKQSALPGKQDAGDLDILVRLPDEPIAVGGVWKERFETDVTVEGKLKKKVTVLRTYRLASVEDHRATIELKTSIITPLRDPAQEAQLIQKAPDGTIVFDIQRGVMLSRSLDLDKIVVGFSGAKSKIRNVTTRTEHVREPGADEPVKAAQSETEQPQ